MWQLPARHHLAVGRSLSGPFKTSNSDTTVVNIARTQSLLSAVTDSERDALFGPESDYGSHRSLARFRGAARGEISSSLPIRRLRPCSLINPDHQSQVVELPDAIR